jgi:hypothetical protein
MTAHTTAGTPVAARLSVKNKIGLGLALLFGVLDLSGPFGPTGSPDEPGPPMAVLVAGAVLGLITIVAAIWTWRTASRTGARIVAGSRILSILGALPAFFVSGVPAIVVAMVAVSVVLTVVTVVLVLSKPAQ